jgi:Nif-specific regulatory protein
MIQTETLSCLYEITQAISARGSLKNGLQKILSILAQRMGMKRGTITILNPETQELQIEIAHGLTAEARRRGRYKLGEGITGRVVENGEPAVVPQVSQEPLFLNRTRSRGDLKKQDISFICVPIKIAHQTIGALSVDRLYHEDIHLDNDLQLLTIICSVIAQAVNNLMRIDQEKQQLKDENLKLREELQTKYDIGNIIGNSNKMRQVFEMIQRVAVSNATVLIRGESGTGKELVASAIHYNSKRSHKPFVRVNCAALPETLVESELFGHEKGAFTGATQAKMGRFELAQRGTIFLDEIGDLSQGVQLKLLRVIQGKEFERVGGVKSMEVDVRIIAATHRDLEGALTAGTFREDLYYRLNVFPIYLPPLRERQTDILLLAEYFLQKFSKENNKVIKRISSPAMDLLMQYHWPGNVREMENVIERAVLICDEDTIRSIHLPPNLQFLQDRSAGIKCLSLSSAVENLEKEMIIEALRSNRGNQSQAAEYLDTSLRILGYKIKQYDLNPRQYRNQ